MTQTDINKIWSMWRDGKKYREIKDVTGYSTSRIGYIIATQITTARKRGRPYKEV